MNKRMVVLLVLLLDFLPAWSRVKAAESSLPPGLRIVVNPSVALYGQLFSWRIEGLRPGERVDLKLASRDGRKVLWRSAAVFTADASGVVDVGSRAPVSGSYAGADIFGLLWSMQPEKADPRKPIDFRTDGVNGWTVDLKATASGNRSAAAEFRCVFQRPNEALVRVPLDQDGLKGFLYYPAEGGPFPGVVMLGGSEGGLYEPRARALAANGFAASPS